jgi:hypothetical protein
MGKVADNSIYKIGLGSNWITSLSPFTLISNSPTAPIPYFFPTTNTFYPSPLIVRNISVAGYLPQGAIYVAYFAFGGALFLGYPSYIFEYGKKCSSDSCRVDCAGSADGYCCIDHKITNRLIQVIG